MGDEEEPSGAKILSFTKRMEDRIRKHNHEQGFSGTLKDQEILDLVRPLQQRFQQRYCPRCRYYDAHKQTYQETGHRLSPEDCRWHWTDILGRCWNYHRRRHHTGEGRPPTQENQLDEYALEVLLQSLRPF